MSASAAVKVMPMLSLQPSDGGLVAIENSTPEVIHVVNANPQRSHQIAAAIDSSSMQTITISAGSLNFPLNLVWSSDQLNIGKLLGMQKYFCTAHKKHRAEV